MRFSLLCIVSRSWKVDCEKRQQWPFYAKKSSRQRSSASTSISECILCRKVRARDVEGIAFWLGWKYLGNLTCCRWNPLQAMPNTAMWHARWPRRFQFELICQMCTARLFVSKSLCPPFHELLISFALFISLSHPLLSSLIILHLFLASHTFLSQILPLSPFCAHHIYPVCVVVRSFQRLQRSLLLSLLCRFDQAGDDMNLWWLRHGPAWTYATPK